MDHLITILYCTETQGMAAAISDCRERKASELTEAAAFAGIELNKVTYFTNLNEDPFTARSQ